MEVRDVDEIQMQNLLPQWLHLKKVVGFPVFPQKMTKTKKFKLLLLGKLTK